MNRIGFIYAITAAITWGLSYTIDQKNLEHATPVYLMLINAIVTIAITLPIVLFTGQHKNNFDFNKETIFLILAAQLLALLANLLILSGIKVLGASYASIFEISYPMFVIFFSFLMFGGTFNTYFWIGSSLMFLGSIILVSLA